MADPAAGTTSPESGAATVSKQLSALVLQDEEDKIVATRAVQASASSLTKPCPPTANGEKPASRPLFSSMRAALESSGQVKEEPGGYVIKRCSSNSNNRQQPIRSGESAGRSKNRHAKPRATKGGDVHATANVEDEADAAGYTVIRRRSSCDESSSSSASASSSSTSTRRNPRVSTSSNNKKQRPRRGSMSALQQSSSLAVAVAPSSSVPPGFQPRATSRVLRPPPGLTPAASGWVVKAAASAENANKIAEPPVEALWPKAAVKTDNGWATTATTESMQAWPPAAETEASAGSSFDDQKDEDDDLLARLGVTL